MHRSGTSVVTHWLHECGLHVGGELLGPGVGNPEGHYEDVEFYWLHRRWLEQNRLPGTGFITRRAPPLSDAVMDQLLQLIGERNRRHPQWGWKEPRTCLFLADYRTLLPEARYLVIFRDYRETISSMIRRIVYRRDRKYHTLRGTRGWIWFHLRRPLCCRRLLRHGANRFLKVWIFYNRQILDHLGCIDPSHFIVLSSSVLRGGNDGKVFDSLTQRWKLDLTYRAFAALYRPDLAHAPFGFDPWIDDDLLQEADDVLQRLRALSIGRPRRPVRSPAAARSLSPLAQP